MITMNRISWLALFTVLCIGTASAGAAPETRYVRHQPSIPLVSEPGAEAVIVKRLTPGEVVTVLGRQGDFVNISANGTNGWVQASDLTSDLPPARQLEQVQAELETAREQQAALERDIAGLQQQVRTARANARNAEQELSATASSQTEELNETRLRVDELSKELDQARSALEKANARVADLEMARSASKLLARTPPRGGDSGPDLLGDSRLTILAIGACSLVVGLFLGVVWRNRQLRNRYYGMEL